MHHSGRAAHESSEESCRMKGLFFRLRRSGEVPSKRFAERQHLAATVSRDVNFLSPLLPHQGCIRLETERHMTAARVSQPFRKKAGKEQVSQDLDSGD